MFLKKAKVGNSSGLWRTGELEISQQMCSSSCGRTHSFHAYINVKTKIHKTKYNKLQVIQPAGGMGCASYMDLPSAS
jgi:hypothetical protein